MAFQIIAVFILLAFYGCYYGKMAMQKKKGIQTDQIGKGKTGVVKGIEMTMKVATILAPIAEVISIYLNTAPPQLWVRIVGAVIGFLGVFMFGLAISTMRDSWRAGVSENDKTELITEGIYSISRNPAFLAFDMVYLGIVLMFFNWPLFLISCFAAFMLHLQIVNVEEDFLIVTFGEPYLEYRRRVNRYLGRKPKK